ncbi:alpha/beta fold hydrolase [Paenibacillus piri]|nr:alpha/beta hydrolase [Paenibacillus piri]
MPTVVLNGTRIHYETAGSGVPIVCIHPPMLSANCFDYLKERLSDQFQIIAFDIRGHGVSGRSRQKLSYPLIAGDIRQLLDALRLPQAYLCGYSTGGAVALQAMLMYPDRFYGAILISTMSETSDWINRSLIWTAVQVSRLRAKRLLTAVLSAGNADVLQAFKSLYRSAIRGHLRNGREYFDCSLHYSCTARLQEIKSPVQLIYGQKDIFFHKYARILQRGLPHNTLQFIPKGRHQLPLKNADELSGLIRSWLEHTEAEREREQRAKRDSARALGQEREFAYAHEQEQELARVYERDAVLTGSAQAGESAAEREGELDRG